MDISTVQDLRVLVRSRRRTLGLSQQELADRAGVSRRWVSMFEIGHEAAQVGHLLSVLQALGLHLRALSVDAPSGTPTPNPSDVARAEAPVALRDVLSDYDRGDF